MAVDGAEIAREDEAYQPPKARMAGFLAIFVPAKNYFVTPILIDLNILIFIAMCLSGVNIIQPDVSSLITWGANFRPSTLEGQWWRLITCCFIHIGIMHLLFNMYALMYIGLLLEPFLGGVKFLLAYFLSGIIASLMSLWWHDFTASAGASGAIFGMYGAFLALLTTNFTEKAARTSLLLSIGVFIAYNLINGVNGQTDNAAHIGGLLGGLFIGYCYYPILKDPSSKQTRNTVLSSISIIILLLTVIVCASLKNDVLTYSKNMEEFTTKETAALTVYKMNDETDRKLAMKKMHQGIRLWYENLDIIKRSKLLKLPPYYSTQNNLLEQYCYSRINAYHFILKNFEENTAQYNPIIERYNKKTEFLINQIKSSQ